MFKRKSFIRTIVSLCLILCLIPLSGLSAAATDSAEKPLQIDWSLLYEDIRPDETQTYTLTGQQETRLERHQRLTSQGFELVALYVVDSPETYSYSDDIIEGTRMVYSQYNKQPQYSEQKYMSSLVNNIYNYSSAITTVISNSPIPYKFSWIPNLLGIVSKDIANQVANGIATFQDAGSYRYCDIEIKKKGWPYWYVNARSEWRESDAALTITGNYENGRSYHAQTAGHAESQSSHYGNETYLTDQAVYYAHNIQGLWYEETAPYPVVVPVRSAYDALN